MRIYKQKLAKSPADIVLNHAQLASAKALLKVPGRKEPPKGLITHAGIVREHVLNDMATSTGLVKAVVNKRAGAVDYLPVLPGLRLAVDNTERFLREQTKGARKLKKSRPLKRAA